MLKAALGEAGLGIIMANLRDSRAQFDPMIPGKRIQAAFGFCDIRDFTTITECLGEGVMSFVNAIAAIVHDATIDTKGAPNKNIGDAFLCVWKESTEDTSEAVQRYSFADRALACVLEVFSELERSVALGAYENHQMIRQRLGPSFRVKMGYGLHAGWAIEGAIGSRHKVDPSYLSAHVNIASRLESATKQYGVNLLMSEAFVKRVVMEENIQGLRLIDRVTVKGSDIPMGIYVFDTKSVAWKLPVRCLALALAPAGA